MKRLNFVVAMLLVNAMLHAQTFTPADAGSIIKFVIKNFGVKTPGTFTGLAGKIVFNPSDLKISSFNISVK